MDRHHLHHQHHCEHHHHYNKHYHHEDHYRTWKSCQPHCLQRNDATSENERQHPRELLKHTDDDDGGVANNE